MACGAFFSYKLAIAFPELHVLVVFLLGGLGTAAVGVLFGLPSLRIKGFYLAVATLAAQFFLVWVFNKFPWWTNYSPRSEEHTSELQSLMRISYAVFCLKKKKEHTTEHHTQPLNTNTFRR